MLLVQGSLLSQAFELPFKKTPQNQTNQPLCFCDQALLKSLSSLAFIWSLILFLASVLSHSNPHSAWCLIGIGAVSLHLIWKFILNLCCERKWEGCFKRFSWKGGMYIREAPKSLHNVFELIRTYFFGKWCWIFAGVFWWTSCLQAVWDWQIASGRVSKEILLGRYGITGQSLV